MIGHAEWSDPEKRRLCLCLRNLFIRIVNDDSVVGVELRKPLPHHTQVLDEEGFEGVRSGHHATLVLTPDKEKLCKALLRIGAAFILDWIDGSEHPLGQVHGITFNGRSPNGHRVPFKEPVQEFAQIWPEIAMKVLDIEGVGKGARMRL